MTYGPPLPVRKAVKAAYGTGGATGQDAVQIAASRGWSIEPFEPNVCNQPTLSESQLEAAEGARLMFIQALPVRANCDVLTGELICNILTHPNANDWLQGVAAAKVIANRPKLDMNNLRISAEDLVGAKGGRHLTKEELILLIKDDREFTKQAIITLLNWLL